MTRTSLTKLFVLLLTSGLAVLPCGADDPEPPKVTRVVETWSFQVRNPNEGEGLPQITCVIAPECTLGGHHAILEVNSWTVPSYKPGGIQLQVWHGNCPIKEVMHPNFARLHHTGETVTFEIEMRLKDCRLEFEIVNGESCSWGEFGGTGTMKVSVPTSLRDLNCYNPGFTIANTAISRGAQNLEMMQFRGYTKYAGDDVVEQDSVAVDKHQFLPVVK